MTDTDELRELIPAKGAGCGSLVAIISFLMAIFFFAAVVPDLPQARSIQHSAGAGIFLLGVMSIPFLVGTATLLALLYLVGKNPSGHRPRKLIGVLAALLVVWFAPVIVGEDNLTAPFRRWHTNRVSEGPRKECARGSAEACLALADLPIPHEEKLAALERACGLRHNLACYRAGLALVRASLYSRYSAAEQASILARGLRTLDVACDGGVQPACSRLEVLYLGGDSYVSMPPDENRARQYHEKAQQLWRSSQ